MLTSASLVIQELQELSAELVEESGKDAGRK